MSLSNIVITSKDTPFNETENASEKLEAARTSSLVRNVPLLILFGGNWCPDARLMSATLEHEDVLNVIGNKFEIVQIDIGKHERNQSLYAALGFEELEGLPAIMVLSPNGELLNKADVFAWRDARNIPTEQFVSSMCSLVD
ncbi:thioredoxin family protein [Hirschia baltica]|uniref:Thiol-disulfide isomerase n=1 Tax=Hirschia baltica (strain ATCC 49814 / DSM 5838 / IFAM 1418) TaxID=582402 RepID=C6XMR1_HIRBI|nr:thioredoxin family protein [Hirschia baltica]ACT59975.1 thiol-disulfide isomerase [Hirschia baltica ATCC 49814]